MKIHIGCGPVDFGADWIHIDGNKDFEHIQSDNINLTEFFRDESIDLIYASHFIEYLNRNQASNMLLSWRRKLKTGGKIRLAVPDFEAMAKLYVSDPEKYSLDKLLGPLYGQMFMGMNVIYHRTCYDFKSLSELLLTIGFRNVSKYYWQATEHSHIDDSSTAHLPHDPEAIAKREWNNHTLISLNVEAIK